MWLGLQNTFDLVGLGDDSTGWPAFYPEIFDRARSPLLARTVMADAVLAPMIDMLSRQALDGSRSWIDCRDISVFRLGNVYARYLEYSLEHVVQSADSYKDKPEANRMAVVLANLTSNRSDICTTHSDFIELFLSEPFKYDVVYKEMKTRQLRTQKSFSQAVF